MIRTLPPGWIDLSIGEAEIVRNTIIKIYGKPKIKINNFDYCYQKPAGWDKLVDLMKERFGKKYVFITNGAKHALCAMSYAIKKLNHDSINFITPYWSQLPWVFESGGISVKYNKNNDVNEIIQDKSNKSPILLVSPNNPDGYLTNYDLIGKTNNLIIHDAAYASKMYTDDIRVIGDVAIHSFSKLLGFSSVRCGVLSTNDDQIASLVSEYIEGSTMGCSIPSQKLIYQYVSNNVLDNTELQQIVRSHLTDARKMWSSVFDINLNNCGMFELLNCDIERFKNSKINAIDGVHFGISGSVRVNLACDIKTTKIATERFL